MFGKSFVLDDIGDNFAFRDFVETLSEEAVIIKTGSIDRKKCVGILIKNN